MPGPVPCSTNALTPPAYRPAEALSSSTALIALGSATVGSETVETVNARDLHAFLGVGKDFSTWIKDRVEAFGFVAGQDFVTVSGFSPNSGKSGRPAVDYHLTLSMAKELAMVERNEAGKRARLYFIECERRAQAAEQAPAVAISICPTLHRRPGHRRPCGVRRVAVRSSRKPRRSSFYLRWPIRSPPAACAVMPHQTLRTDAEAAPAPSSGHGEATQIVCPSAEEPPAPPLRMRAHMRAPVFLVEPFEGTPQCNIPKPPGSPCARHRKTRRTLR